MLKTDQQMIMTKPAGQISSPESTYAQIDCKQTSRDKLIMESMPVVTYIAKSLLRKLPPSVDADDIHSVGVIGLIDAADRFDAKRAIKFRTYAEVRIKG